MDVYNGKTDKQVVEGEGQHGVPVSHSGHPPKGTSAEAEGAVTAKERAMTVARETEHDARTPRYGETYAEEYAWLRDEREAGVVATALDTDATRTD